MTPSKLTSLELREGEARILPQSELSQALATAIYKTGKIEVAWPSPATDFHYKLIAEDTVGQIPVGRDLLIRVAPKVPIANLFRMLEVAYRLPSFQLHEGIIDIESMPDIYERLAAILAKRVLARARKGLYRSYLDESATLGFVRGRIDVRETVRSLFRGIPALHCHFQNHTSDLVDNQILLWALQTICRIGLTRGEVVAQVRSARRVLTGAATVRPVSPRECVGRTYNRLNSDYRPLHGLCRFFLEGAGPGQGRGGNELIPFTVYMPGLFELFVAEWLVANAPDHIRVKIQHKVALRGSSELEFKMDVVLSDRNANQPTAVLDTKYKDTQTPSQADINQVVAYAVELGISNAFLVYPSGPAQAGRTCVGDIAVHSLPFVLAEELDEAGGRFLRHVMSVIRAEERIA